MDPEIEADIAKRTPTGWYGLASPSGWDDLVTEVHTILVAWDPDYEVYQIKEKFGGLRYYCNIPHSSMIHGVIEKAEAESYKTCQHCGAKHVHIGLKKDENGEFIRDEDGRVISLGDPNVELRGFGWVATLCDECNKINEERIKEEGRLRGEARGY